MTFENIKSALQSKKYHPVYFLTGEEPYFIDRITDYMIAHVLSDSEKAFNQMVLYGRDTDMNNIISMARRFPMMAPLQLIIVREAQMMKNLEGLEFYLERPMPTTMLVFAYKYKKIDKRTKIAKLIAEKCQWFESEKIREDKLPAWINAQVASLGCTIDHKAAVLLAEFLGSDLSKISNELEKLILVLPSGSKQITSELIEKNIGFSKDFNNFELTKALAVRDVLKANRIIEYFGSNPRSNPFILTISSLFFYFSKILLYHGLTDKSRENIARELGVNPYFVSEYQQAAVTFPLVKTRKVISWLREYDMKAKGGSNASETDLLKELIYKILH